MKTNKTYKATYHGIDYTYIQYEYKDDFGLTRQMSEVSFINDKGVTVKVPNRVPFKVIHSNPTEGYNGDENPNMTDEECLACIKETHAKLST